MTTGDETCSYTASKDDPSTWYGEEWVLDRDPPWGLNTDIWECPHDRIVRSPFCAFHTDPKNIPHGVDEAKLFVKTINEASAVDDDDLARRKKEFIGATFGKFKFHPGRRICADDNHPIRVDHAIFSEGITATDVIFDHPLSARALFR